MFALLYNLSARRCLPVLVGAVLAGAALMPCAWAQQADTPSGQLPANKDDLTLVVARQVNPRIAYRGIERDRNPAQAQATIFPGRVFHATLEQTLGVPVDDASLQERASLGLGNEVMGEAVRNGHNPTLQGMPPGAGNAGAMPMDNGPAGTHMGGVVNGATRGLGSRITNSLMPALNAATPDTTKPGGGP